MHRLPVQVFLFLKNVHIKCTLAYLCQASNRRKQKPLLNVNLLQSLNLEQYDDTKIKLIIIIFNVQKILIFCYIEYPLFIFKINSFIFKYTFKKKTILRRGVYRQFHCPPNDVWLTVLSDEWCFSVWFQNRP